MAKKRPANTAEITSADNPVIVEPDDNSRWHGVYTPLWRAEVYCGVGSLASIQQTITETANRLHENVRLDWHQDESGNWYATGNDGSGETTLVIARVERVLQPANQWGQ